MDYDPVISSVTITNPNPIDTDALHARFKVTDADPNDTLTADVIWYKQVGGVWTEQQRTEGISILNNVEYTTSGDESLPNTMTSIDEQWMAKVIAHDGYETASIRKYCSNDICLWLSLWANATPITNFGGRDIKVSAAVGIAAECQTSNGIIVCVYPYTGTP